MIPKIKKQSRGKKSDKPTGIAEKVICLVNILNKIDQQLYPSPVTLSEEFGLSRRSIHRYLEIINFIVPIEYDSDRKGYRFAGKTSLRKLQLTEDEMMLMLMLGDSIAHMGTPLKDSYNSLVSKFLSASNKSIDHANLPIIFNIPEVNDTIAFQTNFPIVSEAILKRRVNPYGLVFSHGNWILVGHCHLADEVRKFDLDRIIKIKETWLKFKSADFKSEKVY